MFYFYVILMSVNITCGTFEVKILGSVDILGDRLCVHLQRVCVGSVPRDDHVVPLVVVQWVVTVPLQQTRPIPQVKHVVDEPGREEAQQRFVSVYLLACGCRISVSILSD